MNQGNLGNPRPSMTEEERKVLADALASLLTQPAAQNAAPVQQSTQQPVKEIDLIALIFHLLGKLHIILLAALLCAVYMGHSASKSTPMYSATSKLYMLGSSGSTISLADMQINSMLTMDYQEIFKTWELHEMVRTELDLPYTYSQMQSMISISNPEDTRILYITARHSNAQMASSIANAYANAAKKFILQTMDTEEPSVFSVALVPSVASVVSTTQRATMGFLLGAVLAVGVFTLLFVLDDRPHAPEELARETGVPTLAVLPVVKEQKKQSGKNHRRRHR